MPKYALFDPAVADPKPVIGWYDTDSLKYPTMPPADSLFVLTYAQWVSHFSNPDGFAVAGGALETYTAPVPPAPQQPILKAELSLLDMSIPRGLEDMWAASGFDITKLPEATQTKLARKATLRTELAALIASNTP